MPRSCHYRDLIPMLAIGAAPKHAGPADYWLEALKIPRKEDIPTHETLVKRDIKKSTRLIRQADLRAD